MVINVFMAFLAAASASVHIDGDYPQGRVFLATFRSIETITVRGQVPKTFVAGTTLTAGSVRIWHGANDGSYRVSHAKGSYAETRRLSGAQDKIATKQVAATSEFDKLGYPKRTGADPSNLIPIFPGHEVHVGDVWTPVASVSGDFGRGLARYYYRLDRIETTPRNHKIAVLSMTVEGHLAVKQPAEWKTFLSGNARIRWDCTLHQRQSSRTSLRYVMERGQNRIIDDATETDVVKRVQ